MIGKKITFSEQVKFFKYQNSAAVEVQSFFETHLQSS